jgi:hypothetical protein
MGMGTENTMSIMNWDKSLEKPNGGDFSSLTGRGREGVALFGARVLTADTEETLEKGDGLLDPSGAMAGSSNDERVVTVLPVPDAWDGRDRPGNGGHDCVELKHRKGVPLEGATLSMPSRADSSIEK